MYILGFLVIVALTIFFLRLSKSVRDHQQQAREREQKVTEPRALKVAKPPMVGTRAATSSSRRVVQLVRPTPPSYPRSRSRSGTSSSPDNSSYKDSYDDTPSTPSWGGGVSSTCHSSSNHSSHSSHSDHSTSGSDCSGAWD